MKKLSWLSVEDYGITPLEMMVVSTMKGYLWQMPEEEALHKVEEIIEPKVIQLAGEDGAPMPVQSIIEGAKLAAFIDEAVADALKRMEQGKSDVAQIAVEMLRDAARGGWETGCGDNESGVSGLHTGCLPEFEVERKLAKNSKRKFLKPVDNMVDVEYNIDETKKVSVWRHVKAVLRLGRLITGTL